MLNKVTIKNYQLLVVPQGINKLAALKNKQDIGLVVLKRMAKRVFLILREKINR